MKRFILLFSIFLLSVTFSYAQTNESTIPQSWLEGINPRTGKQVKNLSGELLLLVKPETLETHSDGTSTFTFSKASGAITYKRVRTWKLSAEGQSLIKNAINNRWWVFFIYKDKKKGELLDDFPSILSLSLVPYDFETADSIGGPVPEKEKPEWITKGVTFSNVAKGDTVTHWGSINMLALKNGNAYFAVGGYNDLVADKGYRDFFHIDHVAASALPFLRFIVKNDAIPYITYDKSTRKVYKIRICPGWNEKIMIGKN